MAYNPQPGYETASSPLYRQQKPQYTSSERPLTAESRRNPQTQNFVRAQTPQGGFRDVAESNQAFGRRDGRVNGGWSGERSGRGEVGQLPQLHTSVETRRDLNSSSQVFDAARPYHASPASQFKEPQFDRYQNQEQNYVASRRQATQPSQLPSQGLPTEPVFDNEFIDNDASKRIIKYNRSDPRDYQAQSSTLPFAASKSSTSDQRGERDIPRQQQDYAELYRQELFQEKGSHVAGGFSPDFSPARVSPAQVVDGRLQKQPSRPHQIQGNKPQQQRIVIRPTSPETVSWDNPFPTFGAKKKRVVANDGMDLNNSMSRMKLNIDAQYDSTSGQRPQTASSKSSQTSSFTGQRRLDERSMQQASSPISQRPSDSQFDIGVIRPPPGRLGQRTSVEPIIFHGRHSEETRVRPSLDSSIPPNFVNRRSRTMPSNIHSITHDLGSQREYANDRLWQEPGPAAGLYGSESTAQLETMHAKNFSRGIPNPPNSTQQEAENATGNSKSPLKSTSNYPRHSAHNSLGDVYDSYYHESGYDQQAQTQNKSRQRADSFDEDMPNFDAVPAGRMGHRRGMTIDEHLQPQASLPDRPQPLAESHHGTSRENGHIAGQFNRSKSQPNLKEQRSRDAQSNNGFVFDLPGDAPPLPLVSPQRDTFAHPNAGPPGYLGDNGHMTGLEGRTGDVQRGVPAVVRSNGRAILNESYQQTFQGGSYPERYRSPALQNEYAFQGPGIAPAKEPTPASAILPTSPSAYPPNNADSLPPHPAPIRLGLMQNSAPSQAAKPPPIRQYNNSVSSLQPRDPIPIQGAPLPSNTDPQSIPVTHEELEKLRQAVKSKPSDQKTQLLLAKKMVEASMILADDAGRADPKTKNKNREKYIIDAYKIVKKLVSGHSTDATFYLADCYSCGLLGLETDPKEAFVLYQTAAKAGHAQSAYRVAVCYEMGQEDGGGTKRDPSKAVQWYQRAATLGDTPAMYKLGVIQLKGLLGQSRNPKEALKWLKRAAEQANDENPHALHELGLLYEGAGPKSPVKKDIEYSKQLFMQAANLGYKFSQFRLGCAYEYGLNGCPVDPRQSIAWYSKAAIQEEHQSELALSGWYLTGLEGVLLQSDTEAYLWARKAAQAGLAKAEYAMGYFTEVGIGVPANVEDAKRWYWRSASQNFPKARDRLEALRKGGAKMEKSRVSRSAIRKQTEGDCTIM